MKFLLQSGLCCHINIFCLLTVFAPVYPSIAQIAPATNKSLASSPPLINKPTISSDFGMRLDPFSGLWQEHRGIDLMAKFGAPILATNSGRISFAGFLPRYGNMVEIDHGDGFVTRYGHAEKVLVKTGDFVQASQTIAHVGSSGKATGPHLHFEVIQHNALINPRNFLGETFHAHADYPSPSAHNERAIRTQYTIPAQFTQNKYARNIESSTNEIKPRIIYLTKK